MKTAAALALAALAMLAGAEPEDWGDNKDEWANAPEYAESRALCRAVWDKEPPSADRPDAVATKALEGCGSEALYYGIGIPADPARARQCAFLEAGSEDGDIPFAGRAMLMTIYANGVGAKRDLDVATHLACQVGWAPAESHGRVMHLAEMKREAAAEEFDFCDDVTSGYAIGFCAQHGANIAAALRRTKLEALSRGWLAAEKAALVRLQAAADAFAESHASGEIDLSGSWRSLFWTSAREGAEEELVEMLTKLSKDQVPHYDAAQLKAADAKLNSTYRQLLRDTAPEDSAGTVRPEGIKQAQRAWLRYRDAFLAFAAVKYPRTPRESLAGWITDRRIRMWADPRE